MKNLIAAFSADESGATAIEYTLLAALISIAVIAGATTVGSRISILFSTIAQKLTTATPA
jgi:pilus assembly protein Flp/PilA